MIHHLDQSSPARRGSRRLEISGRLATKRDPGEYIGHSTDAARWTDDPGDRGRVAIRYPHPAGIRICDFAIHPSPAPLSVGQQIAFLPPMDGGGAALYHGRGTMPMFSGPFPSPISLSPLHHRSRPSELLSGSGDSRAEDRAEEVSNPDSRPTPPPSSPSDTLGRKRTVIETAGRVGLLCALLVWWLNPGLCASESQFKKKVQIDLGGGSPRPSPH